MTMEDRHVALVHPQFNEEVKADSPSRRAFFAVYDGHGGHVCAEYCKRHLHHNLSQDPKFGVEEKDALFNCIMTTEENFYNAAKGFNLRSSSGTCAIIAYFVEDTLYVGNVGGMYLLSFPLAVMRCSDFATAFYLFIFTFSLVFFTNRLLSLPSCCFLLYQIHAVFSVATERLSP